jgi:mRNA interferase RelE/StbE
MTFRLKFLPSALKEWRKIDADLRGAFKKKLTERLAAPEMVKAIYSRIFYPFYYPL